MILFIILGVVVLLAVVVIGVLFFMLSKEGAKKEEDAVPLTDLNELKQEFSSTLLEPQQPKVSKLESEIIPPFEPKVAIDPAPPVVQSSILQLQAEEKPPLLQEEQQDDYKKRAKELEMELQAINLRAEGQAEEAKHMIEVLTKENEALKTKQADLEQAQQKLTDLGGESSNLKNDNIDLQNQLESVNTKVKLLEEQLASVKIQMGEEISRANAAVEELTREKEALLASPKAEPDKAVYQELEVLKTEHVTLTEKYKFLEQVNQDLHKLNTELNEKNEASQYQLIKLRAQSSGLERVSFNYKNQLEDFLKKMNVVQVNNEQLSQVKNRLEGLVQEVQSQNEELAKKDQLAQFELEKNRSRLVNLEREYEDLKARAQQEKG